MLIPIAWATFFLAVGSLVLFYGPWYAELFEAEDWLDVSDAHGPAAGATEAEMREWRSGLKLPLKVRSVRQWREEKQGVFTRDLWQRSQPMDTMPHWRKAVHAKMVEFEEKQKQEAQAPKVGAIAGGYKQSQKVKATHDITVRGKVIVKKDTKGSIVGPSQKDPKQRVLVQFSGRDRKVSVTLREVKAA